MHTARKAVQGISMRASSAQDPEALPARFDCPSLHSRKEIGGFLRTFIVFPSVHPLVYMKRASRSLTKTGFSVGG